MAHVTGRTLNKAQFPSQTLVQQSQFFSVLRLTCVSCVSLWFGCIKGSNLRAVRGLHTFALIAFWEGWSC